MWPPFVWPWRENRVTLDQRPSEFSTQAKGAYQLALAEAQQVFRQLSAFEEQVTTAAEVCLGALRSGRKIIAFGNGGSACEAQHLVGELIGRYKSNRKPLAAVALNADAAVITCIGNDFSFEDIFARQVEGLCQPGDVLVAFSTSGNSPNVLRALELAGRLQIRSIAFLGGDGGKAAALADCTLVVPHRDTARIQEGHNFLMHSLMDVIEAELGIA
jgi:D-sedoheptulose 7-phosphate isomerase